MLTLFLVLAGEFFIGVIAMTIGLSLLLDCRKQRCTVPMNIKSKRLAVVFGLVVFAGTAVVAGQITADLTDGQLSIGDFYEVFSEAAMLALPAALFGYVWGIIFPPRHEG